jgi:hypothetical protein
MNSHEPPTGVYQLLFSVSEQEIIENKTCRAAECFVSCGLVECINDAVCEKYESDSQLDLTPLCGVCVRISLALIRRLDLTGICVLEREKEPNELVGRLCADDKR